MVDSSLLTPDPVPTPAELLDEPTGVLPGEELGRLAGTRSARTWERLPR